MPKPSFTSDRSSGKSEERSDPDPCTRMMAAPLRDGTYHPWSVFPSREVNDTFAMPSAIESSGARTGPRGGYRVIRSIRYARTARHTCQARARARSSASATRTRDILITVSELIRVAGGSRAASMPTRESRWEEPAFGIASAARLS